MDQERLDDAVAWTPELRARVYASRARPNPDYLPRVAASIGANASAYPFEAERCYERVRYYYRSASHLGRARDGLANAPSGWRAPSEAAVELASAAPDVMPTAPLDVDQEAAAVTLQLSPVFAAMPYWLAREGVSFALRALVRCHQIVGHVDLHGYTGGNWIIESAASAERRPESADSAWQLLRGALSVADLARYEEAKDVAMAQLERASLVVRSMLAFAFPDQTGWADVAVAGAREVVSRMKPGRTYYAWYIARLCSVAAPADVATLVSRPNQAMVDDDWLTLLAQRGVETTVALEVALEGTGGAARVEHARLLALIETLEAGEILARFTDKRAVATIAKRHAERLAARGRSVAHLEQVWAAVKAYAAKEAAKKKAAKGAKKKAAK